MPLSHDFKWTLNPNSIRKSYPHLVFCIVGLKVDLEDHFSWIWVHDLAVLRSFTRTHLHTSKNGISAPHSTSSPHLAQTEQVRLTRFFALPDSNTSPRVTISVLGHVVVSQMGIVQVPYATVTVKNFRALSYGLCSHGLYSYGLHSCMLVFLMSVFRQ